MVYNGSTTPFSVKSDRSLDVAVGRNGQASLWDDEVEIGPLNNIVVFKEDIGRGSAYEKMLTAEVPGGRYTVDTLAHTLQNELNRASADEGYGLNYQVGYDTDQKKFVIQTDGAYQGFIQTTFLWENGGDGYLNKINTGQGIEADNMNVKVMDQTALSISTTHASGETRPMRFVWDGDGYWEVKDNPGYVIPTRVPGNAYGFELDLDESGSSDIIVSLETPAAAKGAFIEFEIVPEEGDHSIGHELGFGGSNTITSPPVSDTRVTYITDLIVTANTNDTIDFIERGKPSVIAAGTVFDSDYTAALDTAVASGTIMAGSTLASGSVIVSGTTLGAGSVIGSGITLVPGITLGRTVSGVSGGTLVSGSALGAGTILGSGTILVSGTTLGSGTAIGSGTILRANIELGQDIANTSGGTLMAGTTLGAGTVLGNGTALASGTIIGSGTTLAGDARINADITLNSSGTLTTGSYLASGSSLGSGTILAAGEQIALTSGAGAGAIISGDGISTLAALASGALGACAGYTVISGGDFLSHGITTLAAGSTLAFGTASGTLMAGSVLNGTQMTLSSGILLTGDMTLAGADMALAGNMTIMAGTSLTAGSVLQAGSSVADSAVVTANAPVTLTADMTTLGETRINGSPANSVLAGNMTLAAGTALAAGSVFVSGSSVANRAVINGANIILTADMNVSSDTGVILGADITVQAGTLIAQNSVIETGSVLDEDFPMDAAQTIAAGTVFPANLNLASATAVNSGTLTAGTTLASGSTIVAGSILGSGSVIGRGTVLTADVKVAEDIMVQNSGALNAGSFVSSGSTLAAATVLTAGEQIFLSSGAGAGAVISGDGARTLAQLASGAIGVLTGYSVISGDTLSNGITSLQSGSVLSFSNTAGPISSGSVLAGSRITLASGATLNGNMSVKGEGVGLGADMTITAGTVLAANSVVAAGSALDADVATGGVSGELTATITAGTYTDMDALCLEIKTQLEAQSANNVTYAVTYDPENSRFNIREDGSTLEGLDLLWETGSHAASSIRSSLGFYRSDDILAYPSTDTGPVHCAITIDDTNDTLDFEEIDGAGTSSGTLKAFISHGTYSSMTELLQEIETSMEAVSANGVDYTVSYDNAGTGSRLSIKSSAGALTELRLFEESGADSIQDTLGFDSARSGYTAYDSKEAPVLMTFDNTNQWIDFKETHADGRVSEQISIKLPSQSYTDLDQVADDLEAALNEASPYKTQYDVVYDFGTGKFTVKGSDANLAGFSLLWNTGRNADQNAAKSLGFDPAQDDIMTFVESDKTVVNVRIDASNNKIDFQEKILGSQAGEIPTFTAVIEPRTYTSYQELAQEIEEAMELESHTNGHRIDYRVSWDENTHKMSIKENGTALEELRLLWQSGENAPVDQGGTGTSMGHVLGFDGQSDDVKTRLLSTRESDWGIFNSLIDLKQYLIDNDRDGIERSIGRLETHYDNMTARIVDSGMKYNRLEVRQTITTNISLTLKERKSMVEDADMVESIMVLQNIQLAYQAAMSSTAKVLNLSLLDYLK